MISDKKYNVIYADPPWSYSDKGFGKNPNKISIKGSFAPEAGRYETMTLEAIKLLPVKQISSKDCVLLMWATSPFLPDALDVMKSWGFRFKTVAFCWSKITVTGKEVANLGQWTMGNVELCLLGTRGSPKRLAKNVRQLVIDKRIEHSRKPEEVRKRIEILFGNVPRLEMFARGAIDGWDVWGDEAL